MCIFKSHLNRQQSNDMGISNQMISFIPSLPSGNPITVEMQYYTPEILWLQALRMLLLLL